MNTGNLPAPAPRGLLARLGLATADERLGRAPGDSRLVGAALATSHRLHDALRGWIQGSVFARHAEALALGATGLLFLASPWVGTGINAALVLLALAFVIFRLLCQPDTRAPFSALDLLVLAFIAVHVISAGFSYYLVPSLKGIAKMVIYWGAYFVFRQVLQSRQAFMVVVGALLGTAALESAYGVYQWIIGVEPLANWEDPETLDPLTRVYGSLMNPNLLAGYLMAVFPLALTAAAVWRGPWRVVAIGAAALSPLCVWFTYSRGAYIGMVASIAVFGLMATWLAWPRLKQQRKLMYGAAAGVVGVFGLVVARIATSPQLQERIASIFTLRGHSSNSFRMNVWLGVADMVRDNWVIGIGIGNTTFRKMYGLYMVSGYEALGAYNVFLEVLAEMGVVGLAVFLALLVAFVARNLDTFRRGQGAQRWWAAAILAALAGTFAMGMVDTVFYRPSVQLQFWLLLAMTIAIAPRNQEAVASETPPGAVK